MPASPDFSQLSSLCLGSAKIFREGPMGEVCELKSIVGGLLSKFSVSQAMSEVVLKTRVLPKSSFAASRNGPDLRGSGLERDGLQLVVDARKQLSVRIAASQEQVDATHADANQGSDLEQLQPDGRALGLGQIGSL